MRFMTFVSTSLNAPPGPPPAGLIEGIMALGEEATRAGVLVEQGGLLPMAVGAEYRINPGAPATFTDGPFTETKEVVGGYAIYEVGSKEEVLQWTKRFVDLHFEHWPEWSGTVQVRQIMG